MIRIQTGRRLHFGLFTPIPLPDVDLAYGGLGMMVDAPGIVLEGASNDTWSVNGVEKIRLERIIALLNNALPSLKPMRIEAKYVAPSHQGWGTGTQLALALAALCCAASGSEITIHSAAKILGRGERSGIGIEGFASGGLLLDPGKTAIDCVDPGVRSCSFPADWTFVLVEPGKEQGLHADDERQAFVQLNTVDLETVIRLRQLATEVLVPAAAHGDFTSFATTLTQYNRLAGSHYHGVQHGDYSSPQTEERLAIMRDHGAAGTGQSSWGPGLFGLFSSMAEAESFRERCNLAGCQLLLARPKASGFMIDQAH